MAWFIPFLVEQQHPSRENSKHNFKRIQLWSVEYRDIFYNESIACHESSKRKKNLKMRA